MKKYYFEIGSKLKAVLFMTSPEIDESGFDKIQHAIQAAKLAIKKHGLTQASTISINCYQEVEHFVAATAEFTLSYTEDPHYPDTYIMKVDGIPDLENVFTREAVTTIIEEGKALDLNFISTRIWVRAPLVITEGIMADKEIGATVGSLVFNYKPKRPRVQGTVPMRLIH